jgi:hypothetical protein
MAAPALRLGGTIKLLAALGCAALGSCSQYYVPQACLDGCSEFNDRCLLQAVAPSEIQHCDEETNACVRGCYSR